MQLFIDFQKDYDSVSKEVLHSFPTKFGIIIIIIIMALQPFCWALGAFSVS
jgi:hypothetical protein